MSIVIFHFCRRKFYGEPAVMNYKWNFQNFSKQKNYVDFLKLT